MCTDDVIDPRAMHVYVHVRYNTTNKVNKGKKEKKKKKKRRKITGKFCWYKGIRCQFQSNFETYNVNNKGIKYVVYRILPMQLVRYYIYVRFEIIWVWVLLIAFTKRTMLQISLQQIWLFIRIKTLKKCIKKTLRKIILRVQLTLDNLRKWNFEGLRGLQNKCSILFWGSRDP